MGSMLFKYPQALSSALAMLRTLQPRAFGYINHVDPSNSVSNYYLLVLRAGYLLNRSTVGQTGFFLPPSFRIQSHLSYTKVQTLSTQRCKFVHFSLYKGCTFITYLHKGAQSDSTLYYPPRSVKWRTANWI